MATATHGAGEEMLGRAIRAGREADAFDRYLPVFRAHFGHAVLVVWAAAFIAAAQAPWIRNVRGLLEPAGRPESTLSYLFCFPAIMAVAWLCLAVGGDRLRGRQAGRNQTLEFGFAAAVALGVFCLAVARIATVASLSS